MATKSKTTTPKAPSPTSFKEAYQRLENIHDTINADNMIDIDQLIKLQKEAKVLHQYCQTKLTKAEQTLQDI